MVTQRFPSEREEGHAVLTFRSWGIQSSNSFIQPYIHSKIFTEYPPHARHTVGEEGSKQTWPFSQGAHRLGKDPWDFTKLFTVAASLMHPPTPAPRPATHTPQAGSENTPRQERAGSL